MSAAKVSGKAAPKRAGRIRAVLADRAADALFGLSGDLPKLVELDVAAVAPNPDQPRKRLDAEELDELARSIERHGLLQPILVKAEDDRYLLVAGQRRLEAFRRLGRERIPALVATGRQDELALVENLQRADLDPLDEAEALQALKERYGYTQDQLARVLAKAKSTISELLALNGLPEEVKAAVRRAERPPSKSVLIEIARLDGEAARLAFWRRLQGAVAPTVRRARAEKGRKGGEERRPDPALVLRAVCTSSRKLLDCLDGGDARALRGDEQVRSLLQALHARLGAILAD